MVTWKSKFSPCLPSVQIWPKLTEGKENVTNPSISPTMRFIYYLRENSTQHHLNVLQKCKLGENETLGSHCGQTDRNVWRTNTPPLNAIVTNVVQFAQWCTLHMFEKYVSTKWFLNSFMMCAVFTWYILYLYWAGLGQHFVEHALFTF